MPGSISCFGCRIIKGQTAGALIQNIKRLMSKRLENAEIQTPIMPKDFNSNTQLTPEVKKVIKSEAKEKVTLEVKLEIP